MKIGVELASLPRPPIQVIETGITGCRELRPTVLTDERGSFTKIFHRPLWEELGLCVDFNEEYVTRSLAGTLRGLHFQVPPMDHFKVVSCLSGQAWDVVLDLRKDSPTRGQYASVTLDGAVANALYIPPGVAHGFCVPGTEAVLHYKLSRVHSPVHDKGVRWDSAGIAWPIGNPILSKRDRELPRLDEFDSPF